MVGAVIVITCSPVLLWGGVSLVVVMLPFPVGVPGSSGLVGLTLVLFVMVGSGVTSMSLGFFAGDSGCW